MPVTPEHFAHKPLDSKVRHALLMTILGRGYPATASELADTLKCSEVDIRDSLLRLEANHCVVLHPGTVELWVMHPFSTTPTLFYVSNSERGWWAPCIWCALGVAVLVPGPVRITTALGGESDPCEIVFHDGVVEPLGLLAHFPITVARAWDNVHRHCASTLVFSDRRSIDDWCHRHGFERGEIVSLEQVAVLAGVWYGEHLHPEWEKPSGTEAKAIFGSAGLTSAHWHVPTSDERF